MNRKSQLFLLALLLFCKGASAQDAVLSSFPLMAIDAGTIFNAIEPVDRPYIRGDLPASGFLAEGIGGEMAAQFVGVKAEKILVEGRLGFSVGLRYTNLFNSIYRNAIFPNHFYVLHRQEGTTTEYLRVSRIEENSHYIGIPLEVRLYFNPRRRWFFLAGGEWSYQFARQVKVGFKDPNMKMFTEDVKALVGGASGHYSSFYMGAGVRLGGVRPRWTLGLNIPLAITETVSSLNTPHAGGAAIHIQYLLSKSYKWHEKD